MNNSIMNVNVEQTMTSREIAELTGKQHFHVIRDIERMLRAIGPNPHQDVNDFKGVSCNRKMYNGRNVIDNFELDYDMTMTLITGYSVPLRSAVIKRWSALEREKQAQQPQLPTDYLSALKCLVESEEQKQALLEQNNALEEEIAEVTTNHASIENAMFLESDEMTISAFATYSGFRMIDIKHRLHSEGLLQSQREFCAYAKAIQDGFFTTRDTVYGRQHVFTRKGVAVAEMLMHGMSLADAKKAWKKGVESFKAPAETVDVRFFFS